MTIPPELVLLRAFAVAHQKYEQAVVECRKAGLGGSMAVSRHSAWFRQANAYRLDRDGVFELYMSKYGVALPEPSDVPA